MAVQYKNLVIIVQTLLLLLAGYHWSQQPEPQLLQQAAVLPAPAQSEGAPAAVTTSTETTAITPDTVAQVNDVAADQMQTTTADRPQSASPSPAEPTLLAAAQRTQQLWSRHMEEGVDVEWAQQYQQELQDFFVTESALKKFNASAIQCRQSSCLLQLKLPEMADATQQQLLLATALNPLREQGKIGVYLIGEVSGEQLHLVIERPQQAE